ncbi:MAG TPA: M23 family metallopeptidase [Vicinamibacterales bacterium]|nr:M23 family metallopeptidase [Vicinamibacterales bacterium]
MTTKAPRHDWRRDVRTFAAGLGCGLLGGALLVFVPLWQYNLLRSPWRAENPNAVVSTTEPRHGSTATPEALLNRPTATTGRTLDADAPGNGSSKLTDAVIGANPSSPRELEERDLLIPVEGVKADQLTRQFTDERGGNRRHEALDILAPRDTPVRAVEDGTIARLFFSNAGGITLYQFDPSTTFCYYYAHLERYADGLREGQTVKKGQLLGYVGTSGNAPKNTPHLHFAIFRLTAEKHWWEGTPIDPYDVFR